MAGAWLAELDRRQRRLLALALACSVVLHLALLYLAPLYFASIKAPAQAKSLTAHLEAPKPAPPPAIEERSEPIPAARREPAAKRAPRPLPVPSESTTQAVPQPPAPEAAAAPPAAASASTAMEARPVSPPAAQAASVPDAGSVAQYRLALIEIARRHKKYPRVAVDNNWEGRADLRMVIDASGALASLSVRKSAGYAALDEEALQMFRSAKSQAPVPPALRGMEFALDVSADFTLLKE